MRFLIIAVMGMAVVGNETYGQSTSALQYGSEKLSNTLADKSAREISPAEAARQRKNAEADERLAVSISSPVWRIWHVESWGVRKPLRAKIIKASPEYVWLKKQIDNTEKPKNDSKGVVKVSRSHLSDDDKIYVWQKSTAALKRQNDIQWPEGAMLKPSHLQ